MSNFHEMVSINKYHLPEECEKHAGYYYQVAEKLAEAKTALDAANDKLKLIVSDTDAFIRDNWSERDGKMTETSVASKVQKSQEVLDIKEEIRGKQSEVYVLEAARSAMDHRKSMLDNLVVLLTKSFYAAPEGGKNRPDMSDVAGKELRKNRHLLQKREDEE